MNYFVFVYALKYMKKCNLSFVRNLLVALLGAFVFWHALALLFDVIDSPPTNIFLWIIMGLIFSVVEIDKSSSLSQEV
jgi:fatty acid desaturase